MLKKERQFGKKIHDFSVTFFRNQDEKIKKIIEKMQKKVYTETGLYNSEKRGKPNNEKNKNRMYHRSRKQYQGNASEDD